MILNDVYRWSTAFSACIKTGKSDKKYPRRIVVLCAEASVSQRLDISHEKIIHRIIGTGDAHECDNRCRPPYHRQHRSAVSTASVSTSNTRHPPSAVEEIDKAKITANAFIRKMCFSDGIFPILQTRQSVEAGCQSLRSVYGHGLLRR